MYLLYGIVDGSRRDVDVVDIVGGVIDIVGGRSVVVGVLVGCCCSVGCFWLVTVGCVVIVVSEQKGLPLHSELLDLCHVGGPHGM